MSFSKEQGSSMLKVSAQGLLSAVPLTALVWGGRGKKLCNNPQALLQHPLCI